MSASDAAAASAAAAGGGGGGAKEEGAQSAELVRYKAPWPLYGMNWSQKQDRPFRLAIGSFVEEYCNKVRRRRRILGGRGGGRVCVLMLFLVRESERVDERKREGGRGKRGERGDRRGR